MSINSKLVRMKVIGWQGDFNSVALTKFLVNDIKRQGRGELQGTGNVIYKLLEALEPIEVLISACDVEEFSLKLTQWGAIFEMEIN